MPQTLVDRFSPVVSYQRELLEARKAQLGLTDIWYGDQVLIPRTPSLAIEPGPFSRALSGIGGKGRTDNTIRIYYLIYVEKIQDRQLTSKSADEMAESVMDVLHEDVTMGGLVIQGFVTDIEPGYAQRSNTLFRSARITWEGLTKTLIA